MVQNVFPIAEEYVEREFIKFGKHFLITSEALIEELERKAKNNYKFIYERCKVHVYSSEY